MTDRVILHILVPQTHALKSQIPVVSANKTQTMVDSILFNLLYLTSPQDLVGVEGMPQGGMEQMGLLGLTTGSQPLIPTGHLRQNVHLPLARRRHQDPADRNSIMRHQMHQHPQHRRHLQREFTRID